MTGESETIKILIADDEHNIRKTLRRILLREWPSFEITEAEDGQAALEKAAENKFDLVITDLMMPRLNGYDLIMGLEQTTPVIVLTGGSRHYELLEKIENLSTSGRILLLIKPFSIEELQEAVSNQIPRLHNASPSL